MKTLSYIRNNSRQTIDPWGRLFFVFSISEDWPTTINRQFKLKYMLKLTINYDNVICSLQAKKEMKSIL